MYYSNNLGTTWHVYGGSELLPRQSLASVCIDLSNSNTIYIGSGDANYYGGVKRRVVGRSTISTSPIFYPAAGTQVYNWTGSLSTAYELWIEAYCGTTLATTSPITLYTSCGTARMQNPESTNADNDIAIRMPNGDFILGLASNQIIGTTDIYNLNEQEITLESMSAESFIALDENANAISSTDFGFTIFPNPATTEVSINYTLSQTNESIIISLVDVQGIELSKESITNPSRSGKYSFNLNNYSAGIYFIKLQSGAEILTKKLILDKR